MTRRNTIVKILALPGIYIQEAILLFDVLSQGYSEGMRLSTESKDDSVGFEADSKHFSPPELAPSETASHSCSLECRGSFERTYEILVAGREGQCRLNMVSPGLSDLAATSLTCTFLPPFDTLDTLDHLCTGSRASPCYSHPTALPSRCP